MGLNYTIGDYRNPLWESVLMVLNHPAERKMVLNTAHMKTWLQGHIFLMLKVHWKTPDISGLNHCEISREWLKMFEAFQTLNWCLDGPPLVLGLSKMFVGWDSRFLSVKSAVLRIAVDFHVFLLLEIPSIFGRTIETSSSQKKTDNIFASPKNWVS